MRGSHPRRRGAVVAAVLVAGCAIVVGAAVATPGMGVLSAPVHARGSIQPDKGGNTNVFSEFVQLKLKGPQDFATQQIVIAGGGHTGWHSHPGPVLVTVKSGGLRIIYKTDSACQGAVYTAGQSFVDRGDAVVHIARNISASDPVELWATYFVPGPAGGAFRLDAPDPGTGC